jgi:hypothetical protein
MLSCRNGLWIETKNTLNKSLELSPEVATGSDAAVRMKSGDCAVVGGAAQLYVRLPTMMLDCANSRSYVWKQNDQENPIRR